MKRLVTLGIILGFICTLNLSAFVMLPYQKLGYDYFELFLRYDTTTLAPGADSDDDIVIFGYVGMDFSFSNLAYNMRIIPVAMEDAATGTTDEISWTVHNIHWQLFKDYDYGIFKSIKPGVQVGVTNLGLPKTTLSQNTALANYLSSYYLATEFHLFNNPRINLYYGMNFNAEVSTSTSIYIFEYEYNKNRLYYEYAYNSSYLGLVLYFTDYKYLEVGINISGDLEPNLLDEDGSFIDSDGDGTVDVMFNPVYSFSLHFENPINRKVKKKKKQSPLNIDEWTYLEMEKALLSFYDQNFKKSLLHYNNVVEKYPNFGLVHLRLGNTYYQLKNYRLAEYHWKKALLYQINNPEEVVYFLKKLEAKSLEIEDYMPEE